MANPEQNAAIGIDDELVVTVRIRIAAPDVLHRIEQPAVDWLPARLRKAVQDFLDPGDVDLAGIEIALPDFRPYNAAGKIVHEFAVGSDG